MKTITPPQTRYAMSNGLGIAYQVIGDGPPDLIWSAGSFNHTDEQWEDPASAVFLRRVARFARLIRFDVLGAGASDRMSNNPVPPFSEQLDAVRVAAQVEQFAVLAMSDAGPGAIEYAATNADRLTHMVLFNTTACMRLKADYPIGVDDDTISSLTRAFEQGWGTETTAKIIMPNKTEDDHFVAWFSKCMRSVGTPTEIRAHVERFTNIDVRRLLPQVRTPTLVLHRQNGLIPESHSKYLVDHIDGATYVDLPGSGMGLYHEAPDVTLATLEGFVGGSPAQTPRAKRLVALLFTDIVDSTTQLEKLGDRDWAAVLDIHNQISERRSGQYGGSVVKGTGDGILAVFPSPANAVHAAVAIRDELARISIQIRSGVHFGEIEETDDDVLGVSVHITARVMSQAKAGEILVSRTVRELTAGSIEGFVEAGHHHLKGIAEPWQLFLVSEQGP